MAYGDRRFHYARSGLDQRLNSAALALDSLDNSLFRQRRRDLHLVGLLRRSAKHHGIACRFGSPSAGEPRRRTALLRVSDVESGGANRHPPDYQRRHGGSLAINSVTSDSPWLTVSTPPATVLPGPGTTVTVTVSPAGLAAGYYRGVITVTTSGGNATAVVTLSISGAATITLGPSGSQFSLPQGGALGKWFRVVQRERFRRRFGAVYRRGRRSVVAVRDRSFGNRRQWRAGQCWVRYRPRRGRQLRGRDLLRHRPDHRFRRGRFAPGLPGRPRRHSRVHPGGSRPGTRRTGLCDHRRRYRPVADNYRLCQLAHGHPVPGCGQRGHGLVALHHAQHRVRLRRHSRPGCRKCQHHRAYRRRLPRPGQLYVRQLRPRRQRHPDRATAAGRALRISSVANPQAASPLATGPTCANATLVPTQTGLVDNFSVPTAWPTPLSIQLFDTCGSTVGNAQIVATFTNGDPPLPLSGVNTGTGVYFRARGPRARPHRR